MWPSKIKLGEQKSKHVGFDQQNDYGPAFSHKDGKAAKRHSRTRKI
jgi:hypothetical protein